MCLIFRIAKNYYDDPKKMNKILAFPAVQNLKSQTGVEPVIANNFKSEFAVTTSVKGGVEFLKRNPHEFE